MKIGITGASGLIGSHLVTHLRPEHEVVRFIRKPASLPDERRWDGAFLEPQAVEDLDAVVHLAGAGVGDKRWSPSYKSEILDSRVRGTSAVATAVARAGVPVLLSSSAIGYYGDTEANLLDETAPRGRGFLAEVCEAWETATKPATGSAAVRTVHLRTGIVLSSEGGALKKQLPIFKAAAGAPLGSGEQYLSWISISDEVAAITHLLTADVQGPVNLVSPNPVTNKEFTKALGAALHRPTLPVHLPGFVLRAALGEFAGEVLTGQRLAPAVLETSGFRFTHATLGSALQAVL
ncbi:MAG: putative NAD-dependent epimerase/dehydratase [Frankiales bacterium]|nr:putative NAD-dependent epimerase/dehydratase [Frankiales bacterium]